MAALVVAGGTLTVRLTRTERWLALHGDVTVPVAAIRGVRVVPDGVREVRGIRAPGTAIPWRLGAGTWRRRSGKELVLVRYKRPAVVVELDRESAGWGRFLVTVDDAEATAAHLRAAGP